MRAQLLFLSGSRRGRTDTPRGPVVRIGSEVGSDIRLRPVRGVQPKHAEIAFDEAGCDFLIKAVAGDVFVNHQQVQEVILKPDDLIEFGVGGPKARFRVWVGDGKTCKPVRTMLRDAGAVHRESGPVASGSALLRDLLTEATWTVRIGVPVLVLLLVALGFAGGWFGGGHTAARRLTGELERLQAEMGALYERAERDAAAGVTREEVAALRAELERRAAVIDRLAEARTTVRRVLEEHSRAVCLLHGTWTFRVPEAMRPAGSGPYATDRRGERVEFDYTGSGFHVGGGLVVTNRHVAVPWEGDRDFVELLSRGFQPELLQLSATFPDHDAVAAAIDATRLRPADRIDVAVLEMPVPDGVPVLEFDLRSDAELRGETVLVVGYPTGVGALLAKVEEDVSRAIVEAANGDLGAIIAGLSARGAVSPVVTRGVLSEVLPTRLVYDAETTSGGSGGPVFGSTGQVLGVNFAITVGFDGSNQGVPARFAAELVGDEGR